MAGPADAPAHDPGTAPVACALSSSELAAQAARWQRLAERAMAGRHDTDDGVRVCFRAGPGVEEELHALVAVDSECCGWARWTVTAHPGELVLAVAAAGEGIAALHAMLTRRPGFPDAPGRGRAAGSHGATPA